MSEKSFIRKLYKQQIILNQKFANRNFSVYISYVQILTSAAFLKIQKLTVFSPTFRLQKFFILTNIVSILFQVQCDTLTLKFFLTHVTVQK